MEEKEQKKSEGEIGSREGYGVETERCPCKHRGWYQIIASLSTVFCSTGTILRRKGNGLESKNLTFED
jgi:hypothetical protein